MIISASRRTDIPAFYSEWLMNRIRQEYALVRNPLYPKKATSVDLSPGAVDAIVFMTRNPGPLLPHLDELEQRGYRFCFQMTITEYPRLLEPQVLATEEAIRLFQNLSERVGPEKVIWRFDPIVLSTLTTEEFIFKTFKEIAGRLQSCTQRVIISFADYYKKVIRNFRKIEETAGIFFIDLHEDPERLYRIAGGIAEIARDHQMEIFSCAEKQDLSSVGIQKGKCIDADHLSRIFGVTIHSFKAKNQRKDCGCDHSQDIGQYDTCLHGCAYCYATKNLPAALKNRSVHDPQSPCLIGDCRDLEKPAAFNNQHSLF
jgi:DNA repair photolyase